MNDLQDYGVGEFLARRFNIVDTASPAPSLAPEVFPVIQVAPPSWDDEHLRGVFLEAVSGAVFAVALQYSHLRIANLPNSGNIVIIEDYQVNSAGEIQTGVGDVTTLLGTVENSTHRDTRILPVATQQRSTQAVCSSEANITPMTSYAKRLTLQSTCPNIWQPAGVVLAPGTSWEIATTGVGVTFYFSVRFRERRAQPSELV